MHAIMTALLTLAIATVGWFELAVPGPSSPSDAPVPTDAADELAEDLEVMSRLLKRSLAAPRWSEDVLAAHPFLATPNERRSQAPVAAFHLEDYGAVFQLEVPALVPDPEEATSPAAADSEWDLWRKRLMQPPAEHADESMEQCSACHVAGSLPKTLAEATTPGSVRDMTRRVLDVLAENGHRVRGLGSDERIAVVLTTPPPGSPDVFPAWGWARIGDEIVAYQDLPIEPQGLLGTLLESSAQSDPSPQEPEPTSTEYRGDILARQGKIAAAVEAYHEALGIAHEELPMLSQIPLLSFQFIKNKRLDDSQRRIVRKLSNTYVQLGEYENAIQLLQVAQSNDPTARTDTARASEASTTESSSTAFPVRRRLTISVRRSDLTRLSRGEIDRRRFDEIARREWYGR